MTKKVKRYSEEFKAEAVKAIENNGGNVSGTARQLGLPMQKLANWQRKANQGKLKGTKQFDSEPPRLYRRLIYLSQAAMPDRIKLS